MVRSANGVKTVALKMVSSSDLKKRYPSLQPKGKVRGITCFHLGGYEYRISAIYEILRFIFKGCGDSLY
jgi:hypothetical protein